MIEFRQAIVAETRGWIGTVYRHQGSDRASGCDCLGLVRGVWRALYSTEAETPPAYPAAWRIADPAETLLNAASRHMLAVPAGEMQAGDLLVFRWDRGLPARHCGILVAPGRLVHAYDAAGKVAECSLAPQWRRRIAGVFAFPEPTANEDRP
ncbi:peptidase P60 [Mesorhizobium sp. Root554]|uniref:NlpC/P60 family protein n=1 Tax=unclassified Mesorhizobium TaxID=325217 RepID=UPI0006F91613|nr:MULTISPECIES: NlpC/P60 family protein [unclassified Mesorhizobium]KQZ14297.1 peptidase P60 [Mesorhizobium sp. Root1471]KQZ36808.1 peptidase P60 [Mesorhizobium sp. Root554]